MNKKILSVLIFSFLFFFLFVFANNCLAQDPDKAPAGQTRTAPIVIDVEKPDNAPEGLGPLISAGINAVIIIAGLLVFVYLVWGGIEWLTSGGDKEKYESARNRITAAVIGLVIVVAAYAIMQLIGTFLGINFSKLEIRPISDY